MVAREDLKMNLPKITIDDMFSTQESRDAEKLGKVIDIKIQDIDDFKEHPFKVIENNEMYDLANSIKENGVLVPAIVRKKENGRYEMISGHRRKFASELADLESLPCIVKDYDDNEATIVMVDSNMQREKILPSEKAFAYKMKMEALSHQGKQTSRQVGDKLKTATLIGYENGDSARTVQRYIRLTELIPELLQKVDAEEIALTPAVELSYLTKDEQLEVLDNIECYVATPTHSQAIDMRKLSAEDKLTPENIENIMAKAKPNQTPRLKLNENKIRNALPKHILDEDKVEDYILKALEYYTKYMRNRYSIER